MDNTISLPAYVTEWKDIINHVIKVKDDIIYVDLSKADKLAVDLIDDLENSPYVVIEALREAIYDYLGTDNKLKIMFTNPPVSILVDIKKAKEKFDKFVVTHGQVVAIELETSKLKKASLVCPSCGKRYTVELGDYETSISREKMYCENCMLVKQKRIQLDIDMANSEFVSFRRIVVQEEPELQEAGKEPESISVWLVGDISESVDIRAGDKVIVMGIMKADTKKTKQGINALVTNHHIIAYGLKQLNSESLEDVDITPEDEKRIKEIASRDDTLDYLASFVSPDIYGLDDIKKSIVLQIVKGSTTKKRDMIHILLVGDPGTGKSTILRNVKKIYPKTIYVSGSAASGRGLTAIAEKDQETGNYVIKAGALVLASGGIALLDEIDKIAKSEAGLLNEAMEHGSVSVSKAGRVMTLKANTCILAAANPKYGKFDTTSELYEQIDIDKTVLSRFDLVFAVTESMDSSFNRSAMLRIIDVMSSKKEEYDFFLKYIAYTRDREVKITDEIKEYLIKTGEELFSGETVKGATMRQFESLVRLATAHAKLKLRDKLEKEDIDVARQLLERSIASISSELDFMSQMVKMSTSKRALAHGMLEYARSVETFTLEDLLSRFNQVEKEKIEDVLNLMKTNGDVIEVRPGLYRAV